jgi:hypothetical protein
MEFWATSHRYHLRGICGVDDTSSTGSHLGDYTTEYVRRLILERAFIYAKLYNPGGSVILRTSDIVDHDRALGYSTEIGNTFHLDLIELEMALQELVDNKLYTKKEIESLLTWFDGMSARDAADYMHTRGAVNVRAMRKRALRKLHRKLEGGDIRGTGDSDTIGRRQEKEDNTVS